MSESLSAHAGVLEYLGTVKVPDDFSDVQLDWGANSALAKVKTSLLPEHDFCPCECLVADDRFGLEIQHHDGIFGIARGPAGMSFANAQSNQGHGYNNMQALVSPNLPPPIRTMIVTKVKTDNMARIVQMWGAAQEALAKAVVSAWENGWFKDDYARTHVLVTGIFIHPAAGIDGDKKVLTGEAMEKSMHAISTLTYLAAIGMLSDAVTGGLTPAERVERAKTTKHPFRGFAVKLPN